MKKKSGLNFDLKQVISYLGVIREGSFTKASRKLKVGQSTISHQINSLEEMLGVILIDRKVKDITLTPEGIIFRNFCDRLMENVENLKNDFQKGIPGTVTKISASSIPSTYILPGIIKKINRHSPDCLYSVDIANSREAIEFVKEGKVEAGVVGKIISNSGLVYELFYSDEIVLVGPPGSSGSIKAGDIKEMPFITREKGSGTRDAYEKALLSYRVKPSDMKIVFECTTSEMVKKSVISDLGISFISRLAIGDELKSGTLNLIKVDGLNIRRNFYVVYLKKKVLSRSCMIFISELTKMNGRV